MSEKNQETAEVQEVKQAVLKSTEDLKKEAHKIVQRRTLYAAGAGLLPFPIVDAALLLGIQITMIRSVSKLYQVEFKENVVKSIIGSLVGTIGAVGVVKSIPVIGTIIGGLTVAVSGAAATYALGRVFTQHFDQGGTLLDFDPMKSREYFEKEFEEGRMFVSDVTEVEEEVEKEKTGFFGGILTNKKKKEKAIEVAEREQLMTTNQDLAAAIAELKEEIAAMKAERTAA
jgi:uncharacterized protein (DUF697 family)